MYILIKVEYKKVNWPCIELFVKSAKNHSNLLNSKHTFTIILNTRVIKLIVEPKS